MNSREEGLPGLKNGRFRMQGRGLRYFLNSLTNVFRLLLMTARLGVNPFPYHYQ